MTLAQCTWEPAEKLRNAKEQLSNYLKKNPDANASRDIKRRDSDEEFKPEDDDETSREKKRGRGRGRGRNGRPPKNQIGRSYKSSRKN